MLELIKCRFTRGEFGLEADWRLTAGDRVAVIGPSGSGKSTLLHGLAGFLPLASGELRWAGHAMPALAQHRPVAMLFQDHNLFPHMTAAQNVGLGLRPTLRLKESERDQVEHALERVGLRGLGARRPAELSGGQQSRVALARVLVMARPVILLDEPFSALGPAQRYEMLEIVQSVVADLDAVLLMVTHDPGEARALSGLVSFVEDGVAGQPRPADAFFLDPPEGLVRYAGRDQLFR